MSVAPKPPADLEAKPPARARFEAAESTGTVVYYWDVGIAGDHLRDVDRAAANPARVFVANESQPGRHYGFLQIDLTCSAGQWRAVSPPFWS